MWSTALSCNEFTHGAQGAAARVKHFHGDCPELTDSRVFGPDQHGVSRVILARPGAKHGGQFGAPRESQVSLHGAPVLFDVTGGLRTDAPKNPE
jgi:hypothetical protein